MNLEKCGFECLLNGECIGFQATIGMAHTDCSFFNISSTSEVESHSRSIGKTPMNNPYLRWFAKKCKYIILIITTSY